MAKVKVVRKGGFFGKLIALLLGIIIGIVAGIGGLAAIVYYAFGVLTIGEVFGFVENATTMDIPETDFVGADYLDKNLIQAITDVAGVISGIGGGTNTFGDLANVSPYVANTIGGLADVFTQYGFEMTKDDLFAMSVPSFGEYMQTSFGNIALAPLITELGGQVIDPSNTIMCALFYGQKGVHYQLVEEEGKTKIEMLPLAYTLESDGNFYNWSDEKYEKVADQWINEDGSGVIKAEPETGTNENGETVEYTHAYYTVKDGVEKFAYRLAVETPAVRTATTYIAYTTDHTPKLHVGATVSGLLGDDLMNTMYSLSLADVLGLNASSDPLMLSLAYGENGYKIKEVNGVKEFEYLTDTPKTLNDLINSGSSLVTDMTLATLLNLNADSDRMMLALAYGEDGYKIEEIGGVKTLTVLTTTPKTINDLVDGGSSLVTDMSIATLLNLNADSDRMMLALAYGEDGYKLEEVGGVKNLTVLKPSKKVNDLVNGGSDLVNDLSIATLLNLNADSDRMMLSLAYGEDGYKLEEVDGVKTLTVLKPSKKVNDLVNGGSTLVTDMSIVTVMDLNVEKADSISAIMKSLAFGVCDDPNTTEDDLTADYKIEGNKIVMLNGKTYKKIDALKGDTSDLVGDIKLSDVMEIDTNSSQILQTLKDTKISELDSKISTLTLGQAIKIDSSSSLIMQNLAGTPINEMSTAIDDLTMSEIMEIKTEGENKSSPILIALKDTPVSGLSAKIDTLTIKDVIEINENSPQILKSLAKKNDGNGILVSQLGTAIDDLTMNEVLDIKTEGEDKSPAILIALKDTKVNKLSSEINGKINTLALSDIIDIDENSNSTPKILKTFKQNGTTVGGLSNAINELKMSEVIEINESSPAILIALKDTKVNELSSNINSKINDLKLSDVITINNNDTFLKHLKDAKIGELSSKLEELTIQKVFADDVYEKETFAAIDSQAFVASTAYNDCGYLYLNDADGKYYYYTTTGEQTNQVGSPVLTGVWSFLLTDYQTKQEKQYAITEMGSLVENMTNNIQTATLQELSDKKLFTIDQNTLDKDVVTSFTLTQTVEILGENRNISYNVTIPCDSTTFNGKQIGDLTILQLIDYITAILTVIG